jgi:CheY-specific phosphatase CheX
MDAPDVVDDDVRDMLGELANMIGGNMKSGMATGIRLSMPTVMDGSDYDLRVCGAKVKNKLAFDCADGKFWVTVLSPGGEQIPEGKRRC